MISCCGGEAKAGGEEMVQKELPSSAAATQGKPKAVSADGSMADKSWTGTLQKESGQETDATDAAGACTGS